ncbi:DUF6308 family protein [Brachybacterium muris]|uniref:DUF6308 family protein n=1 Tax=Brachybacterium muris TaxID=219301 RepID=UPI00223A7402|nr:DUF6308 family protein [Brachybacterium muris]
MTIHDALHQIDPEKGKQLAAQYFEESSSFPGTGTFTGSHFESFAGAPNPVNEVTAADLLAVQTLAVTVSSRAALGILETYAQRISELLSDIDPTLKLEEVRDEGDFETVLGKNSSAQALWDLLRRNNPEAKRWNLGATTASKIMARKRPHLIPIDDSVVTRVFGRGTASSWRMWRDELLADNYLIERADEIKEHVERTDLSTLRALDIVLWQYGKTL